MVLQPFSCVSVLECFIVGPMAGQPNPTKTESRRGDTRSCGCFLQLGFLWQGGGWGLLTTASLLQHMHARVYEHEGCVLLGSCYVHASILYYLMCTAV